MAVHGIIGKKVGMTQIFVETRAVPVTVIKAGPCVVTQVRTQAVDGYDAVQLAYGALRPRDVTKPVQGHFDKAGAEPSRHLVELRTDDAGTYATGQEITAEPAPEQGAKIIDLMEALKASLGKEKADRKPAKRATEAKPARVAKVAKGGR